MSRDRFQHVSESPTRPRATARAKDFDVAELYKGPAGVPDQGDAEASGQAAAAPTVPLDDKLRQAYFWIVNHAIISPYYDMEYVGDPPPEFELGDSKTRLKLPTMQSYSSYVLLPLLNLAVRKRCLLVGGPGRGKTAIAILMGVLAGYSLKEIKRSIQHGQPQMTIADLLGNPLPSTLVNAQAMDDVQIAWRKWLEMRVKIIDEYNRIPTRTQSALLTVMADNYAELYDQVYECPDAAWYLTANDDLGGGTYQVIEALRDRIEVMVKSLHFNTRFLGELLLRIEEGVRPEEIVPPAIVFGEDELSRMEQEVLAVPFPTPLRRRLEFFAAHFEFLEPAAKRLEYMTKDTAKLAGADVGSLLAGESGKDKLADLGSQTMNGLSVRALMTCLVFCKALAWFRGNPQVEAQDLRQILPFVLHDKLVQNPDAPALEREEAKPLRTDHVSWIRTLFDASNLEYDRLDLDRDDPVAQLMAKFDTGLAGVGEKEIRARLVQVERAIDALARGRKLYGHVLDDVVALKYLHQRYSNYLQWLLMNG